MIQNVDDAVDFIDVDLLKQYAISSFKEDKIDDFGDTLSVLKNIDPSRNASEHINVSNLSLSKEKLKKIILGNDVNSSLNLISVLGDKNAQVILDSKELIFSKIESDKRSSKNIIYQISQKVSQYGEALKSLYSLSKTQEDRIEIFNIANGFIYNLIQKYSAKDIDLALREELISDGFSYYVKSLVSHQRPQVELNFKSLNSFNKVNYLMAQLIRENDLATADLLSDQVCQIFGKELIQDKEVQKLKAEDVGCLSLVKTEFKIKKMSFNNYAIYQSSGTDITLTGDQSVGGVFNLSSKLKIEDVKVSDASDELKTVLINTAIIIRNSKNSTNIVLPLCYQYKRPQGPEKLLLKFEPRKGERGGHLKLNYTEAQNDYPKLISLGSKGQNRPKQVIHQPGINQDWTSDGFIERSLNDMILMNISQSNIYIFKRIMKYPLPKDFFNDEFIAFYRTEIFEKSKNIDLLIKEAAISCSAQSCDFAALNNYLVSKAAELLESDKNPLDSFTFNCNLPEQNFEFEDKQGHIGEAGVLEVL